MPKRVGPEVQARAVRLAAGHLGRYPSLTAASAVAAKQVGAGRESVRRWVMQAQIGDAKHNNADGGVVFPLAIGSGTDQTVQTWMTASQMVPTDIVTNPRRYYANVHTPVNQTGENRGQLKLATVRRRCRG